MAVEHVKCPQKTEDQFDSTIKITLDSHIVVQSIKEKNNISGTDKQGGMHSLFVVRGSVVPQDGDQVFCCLMKTAYKAARGNLTACYCRAVL